MNAFIGIGRIVNVQTYGKVLKFNLSLLQDKPCIIPCVVFNPTKEVTKSTSDLGSTGQLVWMQGKLSCNEYEYQGKTVRQIVLLPYVNSTKKIE